jgi:hypothetical protein
MRLNMTRGIFAILLLGACAPGSDGPQVSSTRGAVDVPACTVAEVPPLYDCVKASCPDAADTTCPRQRCGAQFQTMAAGCQTCVLQNVQAGPVEAVLAACTPPPCSGAEVEPLLGCVLQHCQGAADLPACTRENCAEPFRAMGTVCQGCIRHEGETGSGVSEVLDACVQS